MKKLYENGYSETDNGEAGELTKAALDKQEISSILNVPVDEFVKQNADKTLAQVLEEAPHPYADYDICCLELSVAAFNPYARNMGSLCLTIGDLLNLTVKQLFEMRNLSRKSFVEIITKADVWLKEIGVKTNGE